MRKRKQFADDTMKVPFSGAFASDIFATADGDAEVQKEIGIALAPDDATEARKFLELCPNYESNGLNFQRLKEYLASRRLSFTAENLRQGWLWMRANGKAVCAEAQGDKDKVSYRQLDRLSDRELTATFAQIVEARRKRRKEIAALVRQKF